jgi:hypothetical protein
MHRRIALTMIVLLLGVGAAWAADQQDEPDNNEPAPAEPGHRSGTFDFGVYADAGKALRVYDMGRLNAALAPAGVSPFTGMIDDWNFELNAVAPRYTLFGVTGGFWRQFTGGSPAKAEASGWEILARYGLATLPTSIAQVFPTVGIGYASRTLELSGNMAKLSIEQLRKRGSEDLREQGMVLEAGVRVDLMSAWPRTGPAAFLAVQSLTVGWQGVPVSSGWLNGSTHVGLPDPFSNALFARFNIGFGGGVRRKTAE